MLKRSTDMSPNRGAISVREYLFAGIFAVLLFLPQVYYFKYVELDVLRRLPCVYLFTGNERIAGYVLSICTFVFAFLVMLFVLHKLPGILNNSASYDARTTDGRINTHFQLKDIALCASIILICWFPYLVLYFPGTTTMLDGINQLYYYLTPSPTYFGYTHDYVDAEFIDDNPVFVTILFGSFVSFGRMIGSDTVGFTLYILFQGIVLAAVLASSICYLEKLKVPSKIRLAGLVFVAIFPIFPCYAVSMQKDVVFSVFLLLYSIMYVEVFRSEGAVLKKLSFVLVMTVVAIFAIQARKTGLYIIGLSGLILLVAYRKYLASAAAVFLVPIIVSSFLVPTLIYPPLQVYVPKTSNSAMHMLYQSSIALYRVHPDAFSEDEYELLSRVIDIDKALAAYESTKTDGVTNAVSRDLTTDDKIAFVKLWLKKATEHPISLCVNPLVRCPGSLVIPSGFINVEQNVSQWGIEQCAKRAEGAGNTFDLDVKNPEVTQIIVSKLYLEFYQHGLAAIPGVSLLFTEGLYGGWIPLFALMLCFFFRKRNTWAIAPALIHSLMLIVNPVSYARYMIPCLIVSVLVLGWAISQAIQSGEEKAFAGKEDNDLSQTCVDCARALNNGVAHETR